jgi:plastocyanin
MRRYLVLAGLLGSAVAVLPGLAAGDTAAPSASFTAVDFAWQANGGPGSQVTIQPGQTVSFAYPSGASMHNADFGSSPAPSVCTQTAGASSGSVPPLPNQPTSPGWSGTCTFNTPGTYNFHCDLHSFMTGTIVVQGPGTTSTTSPPPTTPTSTTPSNPSPATQFRASVHRRQRGTALVGSVAIPATYAGGSLEVDVSASAGSLGLRRHGAVRIGRLVRRALAAGTHRFSVSLSHVKPALRRHHSLPLTVNVLLRAAGRPTRSSKLRVLLLAPGA